MPETGLRFEPVTVSRVAEIHAIEQRAYPFPWSLKILQDTFKAGTPCWGLLGHDHQLRAYAFCTLVAGELQLLNLCVAPECQGQGLGRALMQRLLTLARDELCTIFLLEVRRSNTVARRLYESLGFKTLGVRKGYYPNGPGATEDALVMGYEIV